jgi:hypothetical protein
MPTDISFAASLGLSRIRVPKALIMDLGWGDEADPMRAIGILTSPGELLCAAVSAIDKDAAHPFREALDLRSSAALSEGWTNRASPGRPFALAFRVFEFDAKWVSAAKQQLDLHVGSAITSLCGWLHADKNPPIYAASRDGVLALFSADRMANLLHEQPLAK